MGEWLHIALWGLASAVRSRRDLALENVALRQQLMVIRRQPRSLRLMDRDRLFWVWLRRVWPGWSRALVLAQPATVVGWHRKGFRAYWRWKSRAKGGRPRVDPSVRKLIRHMWRSNPTWGAPRIQAELQKLGIEVSDSTVRRVESMGIEEVGTAPGSPWQNPYCERLIGSIRRECLDHVIVLGERHLLRVLRGHASYYHTSRTHRSLEDDCPDPRPVEPPEMGDVVAYPQVGGLHHRYGRRLAA